MFDSVDLFSMIPHLYLYHLSFCKMGYKALSKETDNDSSCFSTSRRAVQQ